MGCASQTLHKWVRQAERDAGNRAGLSTTERERVKELERILRRMPRMQVYLPDDLYEAVKRGDLPACELLQDAVRAEVRRRELLAASRKYTAELSREVGSPAPRQSARASALAKRIGGRRQHQRKAG